MPAVAVGTGATQPQPTKLAVKGAKLKMRTLSWIVLGVSLLFAASASADVMSVGVGAFPAGSALITFTGLSDGTEVNGLTVAGVTFSYSLGSGQVEIDEGPGITNNINPPNIVSIGNNTGTLTMTLPGLENIFGYGYAILDGVTVANATTISLFDGATPVGSLSYTGVPDPSFTGGFAGIESTLEFNKVSVTFNSVAAPAFALDNVRFGTVATAVPEPSSFVLLGIATVGLAVIRKRIFRA